MKIFWNNAISDNFSNTTDWSTGVVPGPADTAVMTSPGVYTVTSDVNETVLGINTGSGVTLDIVGGSVFNDLAGTAIGANRGVVAVSSPSGFLVSYFEVGGTFNNIGQIQLLADDVKDAYLQIGPTNLKLTGGGSLLMTDSPNNQIVGQALINVNNTIAGAGSIVANINNQASGVIDATGTSNPLFISATVNNAGTLEATGGAGMTIQGTINNTSTGIIYAGTGSQVDLQGAYINGGILEGNGQIVVNSGVTYLTSVTLAAGGTLAVPDGGAGGAVGLIGTFNDLGTISLQSTTLYIVPSAVHSVTLNGQGYILLSDNNNNLITGPGPASPTVSLINHVHISGAGTIGGGNFILNNAANGVIGATGSNPLIVDTDSNTVLNSGTLEAVGGELFVASNLRNTGTLNANGGTILIAGAVSGTGIAIVNGTGEVEFGAASSNGVKFAAGSTGELILDNSKHYTGTVSGFGTNTTQSIDLADIQFASPTKSYANGVLTVKDGVGDIAHIKFSGTHTLASFNLQDDGQGGVLITDPPVSSKTQIGNVALFVNYIASMFASASQGHGAIPTSWMDAPLPHLMSLPHA